MKFPLTHEAQAYVWRQLAKRVDMNAPELRDEGFKYLGVSSSYHSYRGTSSDYPRIIVTPCEEQTWKDILVTEPKSIDWLMPHNVFPANASLLLDDPIPVLFWGAGYESGMKPFAEQLDDKTVVFYVDIIATVFFMLSRWEETVVAARDEHARFPGEGSVAYKQAFLDRPVVDEYALILCAWLKVLLPDWNPEPPKFAIKLSHDIDLVNYFPNGLKFLRSLKQDIFRHKSLERVWKTGNQAFTQFVTPENVSYFQGIKLLATLSKQSGLGNDAFYFMAAKPSPFDNGYDPSAKMVKRCLMELVREGFEVGLHAGYHTLNNVYELEEQKERLEEVLGETCDGGRQHYLRFQAPATWRHWEQVGFAYDSTLAYSKHEGFRCGTCHPFRPFDVERDCELDLWEWPLIVMDVTLQHYRGLTPDQGAARILQLARRCKRVNGTFTLLWHNSSLHGAWKPWRHMYERVLRVLAEMKG